MIKSALDLVAVKRICSWVTHLGKWQPIKDKWMHYFEQNAHGEVQLIRTENFVPYHDGLAEEVLYGAVPQLAIDMLDEKSVLFKEKVNYKAPGGPAMQLIKMPQPVRRKTVTQLALSRWTRPPGTMVALSSLRFQHRHGIERFNSRGSHRRWCGLQVVLGTSGG